MPLSNSAKRKQLASSPSASQRKPKKRYMRPQTDFADLPTEIRLNVYRYLLRAEHVQEPYQRDAALPRKLYPQPEYRFKFQTAILAICSKFHDEAIPIYCDNPFIQICSDSSDFMDDLRIESPAMGIVSNTILQYCHLRIEYLTTSKEAPTKQPKLIITHHDLPLVIHFMNRWICAKRKRDRGWLRLEFLNPAKYVSPTAPEAERLSPPKLQINQKALLEPFRKFCLFRKATITNADNDHDAQKVISKMQHPALDGNRWHKRARPRLEQTYDFSNPSEVETAIQNYSDSVDSFQTVTAFDPRILATHILLLQKLAHAHLCIDQYSVALDYTDVALRYIMDAEDQDEVQQATRTIDFFCVRELASCEAGIEIPKHADTVGVSVYWQGQAPELQRKRNAFLMWIRWLQAGDKVMQKAIMRFLVFKAG